MCLILIAWQSDADFPLILAANRDEYFERPTEPARFWDDAPDILAGRDLRAGGTWLGIARPGRFVAVTNIREPPLKKEGAVSRGLLAIDFLKGDVNPGKYLEDVTARLRSYDAFNFIAGDADQLWFLNSREARPRSLAPGLYGISNGDLDAPWPKVLKGKREMQHLLESAIDLPFPSRGRAQQTLPLPPAGEGSTISPSPLAGEGRGEGSLPPLPPVGERRDEGSLPSLPLAGEGRGEGSIPPLPLRERVGERGTLITTSLFTLLSDRTAPNDTDLPATGVGLEWERLLSPIFVRAGGYGTRSSTIVLIDSSGHVHFHERSFDGEATLAAESRVEFQIR